MTAKSYINWKALDNRQNQSVIETHLNNFNTWLETNAVNQSRSYINTIKRLLIHEQITHHQITPEHIDHYLKAFTNGLSKHTILVYLSRIRKWLQYLNKPYADLITAPHIKRRPPTPKQTIPDNLASQLAKEKNDWLTTLHTFERAATTISTYDTIISLFQAFIPKSVHNLTTTDLLTYIHQLKKRNTKPQSINNYRRVTRLYLTYHGHPNLYDTIPTLKTGTPLRRTAPFDHTTIILEESKKDTYPTFLRPILSLITLTGIRIGTIVNLRTEQIDLQNHWLTFWTKGNKEQKLPFNKRITPILQHYIDVEHPHDYLFPHNRTQPNRPLNTNKLRSWLQTIATNTNLPYYNPHAYRRSIATHIYYKSGENLLFTKTFLNHASAQTTLLYIDIDYDEMKHTYDKITDDLALRLFA